MLGCDAGTAFRVQAVDAPRSLAWAKPDSTWAWTPTARPGERTRLVTRLRQRYDWSHPAAALLAAALMELGDSSMMRRMLLTIRRRAEASGERTAL